MKTSTLKAIGWGLIILPVVVAFTEPNFGFVAMDSAEAFGFNSAKLFFPIIGIVLILSARKREKVEKTKV